MRFAVFTAMMLAAAPAFAQPARDGNTWDWRSHQPTQGGVEAKERQAGVAPDSAQQRRNAATVDQLDKQLLGEERANPPR